MRCDSLYYFAFIHLCTAMWLPVVSCAYSFSRSLVLHFRKLLSRNHNAYSYFVGQQSVYVQVRAVYLV